MDGVDRITDFTVTEDRIAIFQNIPNSGYVNAGLTPNAAITAAQLHIGTSAADTTDRFIYDNTTGSLFFDADGSGATAQVQIATLAIGLAITQNNIFVLGNFDDQPITPPPPPPPPPGATAGDDILTGSNADEMIDGLAGNDTILGLGGNDTLMGGQGNDNLKGGDGNDRIFGGDGLDKIWSGAGNDVLSGGKAKDLFALQRGSGRDVIRDFKDRQDKLGLTPGMRFGQLDIEQKGGRTLISLGNDQLAIVMGVRANQITAADFARITAG